MTLKAVIVDDKAGNIETLKEMISGFCPALQVSGVATGVAEAYTLIHLLRPDIVFLDIEMEDGTGFDLLQRFREPFFETIFTTAYDQYAVQAIREQAIGYLLKPVDIGELQEAVRVAESRIKLKSRVAETWPLPPAPGIGKVSLPLLDGYLFLEYENIIRIEGSGSYSNFFCCNGERRLVSLRLKECEDILPTTVFCRVHNSHIVNLHHVHRYMRGNGGYLIMSDNTEVDVSASRKEAFLKMMKDAS